MRIKLFNNFMLYIILLPFNMKLHPLYFYKQLAPKKAQMVDHQHIILIMI